MRFRKTNVRTKITALILSMVALWSFAAWVTVREGVNMLSVGIIDQKVTTPLALLVTELQNERRLTLVKLAKPLPVNVDALTEQRKHTEDVRKKFEESSRSGLADFSADSTTTARINDLIKKLESLDSSRGLVDTGSVDGTSAARVYTDAIDAGFRLWSSSAALDDKQLAKDARTLISLLRAREVLAREDDLLTSSLTLGRINAVEHAEFVRLVGTQHFLFDEYVPELPTAGRERFEQMQNGAPYIRLTALENQVANARALARLGVTATEWHEAVKPVLDSTDELIRSIGDGLVDQAKPVAIGVIVRLVLAGGLGFLAVIASVILSVTTARHLVRQLERLKTAAHELSDEKLPNLVERLGQGEKVDIEAETVRLEFGDDDIGQVGQAFNTVQQTAIRVAVEQAELRRSIRDILLSLARRSQALVHRQLTLLDTMERREIDTEELEDLFRVDHLATRMRRNAENLIILSGSTAARGWRRPVPMVDVVRSAVAEVEDYTRVAVLPIGEVSLTGRAVGDLAHLLAELIENAVSFSPPYTVAQISGHMVASGYAIEIEDRGLGMSDESLEQINQRIADPPEFNLSSSAQLGLYVVGRLAERYRVQVTLKRSPYGGTTAVVVIPRELIEEGEADAPVRSSEPLMSVGAATVHEYAELSQSPEPEPVVLRAVAEPANEPTTPSGLPLRVPQASLAAPLREEPADPAQAEDDPGRSPEEIRKIVGAFQSGSLRGRSDATASEKSESETE
jgi:signal transduction histidine kinase